MQVSLSKRSRDGKDKLIAVWSPVSSGKTTVAVNLAFALAKEKPVALVDLAADNAVFTWTNCSGTNGLHELINGNASLYYESIKMPGLQIYTGDPKLRNSYNGEASILSNISKALSGIQVVCDTPRDYLKAANILALADVIVLVADYNLHGSILLKPYVKGFKNKALVVNRHSEGYSSLSDPVKILSLEAAAKIPDNPYDAYSSVLTGSPFCLSEFEELARLLRKEKQDA